MVAAPESIAAQAQQQQAQAQQKSGSTTPSSLKTSVHGASDSVTTVELVENGVNGHAPEEEKGEPLAIFSHPSSFSCHGGSD